MGGAQEKGGAEATDGRDAASRVERVFLGWDGACLDAAAAWLLARAGPGADLSRFVVALPGARAGRRLLEKLVERAAAGASAAGATGAGGAAADTSAAIVPPEITTAGHLTDTLLALERPAASGLARTLAWQEALAALDPKRLRALLRDRPAADDVAAWRALAEDVRARHAELGREGRRFAEVVPHVPAGAERARWEALAAAHALYAARLGALGLADPHDARREAIEAGAFARAAPEIVLVGVSEIPGLLRALLLSPALPARLTALVFAPPAEVSAFDALGAVRPEAWAERDLPIDPERWHVEERPADQARRVVDTLAGWGDRFAVEEVTLGVPGLGARDEVVPHLAQRLAAHGLAVRPAVGPALGRTGPWRLLEAVTRLLERGRFEDLAALVRHPDLERRLAARGLAEDYPALLDDYHAEHLPARRPRRWLEHGRDAAAVQRHAAAFAALDTALSELLGELGQAGPRELPRWAAPVRELLVAVYGGRDLRDDDPDAEALGRLGAALDELEAVPPALAQAAPHAAAAALDLLLMGCAHTELPPPRREGLELLGWLELPLDDARALVVVNVEEGMLPEHAGGLPDALRRRLGMADDALRLARDAHALALLLHSHEEVVLVTGRRREEGDPVRPSRLLFHVPPAEVPARVLRWAERGQGPAPLPEEGPRPRRALPMRADAVPPARFSVTAFRDWFASPYLFYLRRVLFLESAGDGARELEPRRFGTLLHEVLAGLGDDEGRDLTGAAALGDFLVARLDRLAARHFGDDRLPAVSVQLEQARRRLGAFAAREAARRDEGWRIARVECKEVWQPDLPGGGRIELVGKVDRIDVRGAEWAILDYKTGDKPVAPGKAHGPRKDGGWRDVQLPLYERIFGEWARGQGLEGPPGLGYALLPRTAAEAGFSMATWTPAQRTAAVDCALAAVVEMRRAGAFTALGRFPRDEDILAAIAGLGVLGGRNDEDGENGTAELLGGGAGNADGEEEEEDEEEGEGEGDGVEGEIGDASGRSRRTSA